MALAESTTRSRGLFEEPADDTTAYTALRNECAAWDRSDTTFVRVGGDDAELLLQRLATRDLEYLSPERCTSSLFLRPDGSLIDLVTIYRFDESFLVEASPGGGPTLLEHLRGQVGDDDVTVEDLTGTLTCLSVEGPYAWSAAGRIVAPELAALPLDSVIEATWNEHTVTFCRSGVTGEYGYKFIGEVGAMEAVAAELAKEVVVGSADVLATAMLEVRHPVLPPGADVATIVKSGVSWLVEPEKEEFAGRDVFHAAHAAETSIMVGFVTEGEVPVADGAVVTTSDGTEVGTVHTSRYSPTVQKAIGLVAIEAELSCVGLELLAGDQAITTAASPFIVPKSWKTPIL